MKINDRSKTGSRAAAPAGRQLFAALLLLPACWLPLKAAAQITPPPAEFVVNQTTLGSQVSPAIASSSNSRFVVAWQDAATGNIFARRYGQTGLPVSDEFRVNTRRNLFPRLPPYAGGYNPKVSVDRLGRFTIAWTAVKDGGGTEIAVRRYSPIGIPIDKKETGFTIQDSDCINSASILALSGSIDGRTALLYGNCDGLLVVRRYSALGTLVGDTTVDVGSYQADVAVQIDGSSAVVYNDTHDNLIKLARYSEAGALLSSTQIDIGTRPAITAAANGGYVISYEADLKRVYAQLISAQGAPVGSRILVDFAPAGPPDQTEAFVFDTDLSADATGRFFVVWSRRTGGDEGKDNTFGRRFEADGAPVGARAQLASSDGCCNRNPQVVLDALGKATVVWQDGTSESDGIDGLDGSQYGIVARQFAAP